MIPVIVPTNDTDTLGWQIATDGETATVVVCWMDSQTVEDYPQSDVRQATPQEVIDLASPPGRTWFVRSAAFALAEVIDRALAWLPAENGGSLADDITAEVAKSLLEINEEHGLFRAPGSSSKDGR